MAKIRRKTPYFFIYIFSDLPGLPTMRERRHRRAETRAIGRALGALRGGEVAALGARDGELAIWLHIELVYPIRRINRQTWRDRDQGNKGLRKERLTGGVPVYFGRGGLTAADR
jgi:hypothetical protein